MVGRPGRRKAAFRHRWRSPRAQVKATTRNRITEARKISGAVIALPLMHATASVIIKTRNPGREALATGVPGGGPNDTRHAFRSARS